MHVAVVHGYFLHDSGSAVYVRELARALADAGHQVTLVCQEQQPEKHAFIDSAYQLDAGNRHADLLFERPSRGPGACRLVRPHIGGRLLTYVAGPFPGFEAVPFPDADDDAIAAYARANLDALETVFGLWPPDLVLANHVVLQPYLVGRVCRAAGDEAPPYTVTVHGSALNFAVKRDGRLVPYALEGLEDAAAVAALSAYSRDEVVEFARAHGLEITGKSVVLPPGVDTDVFHPGYRRGEVFASLEDSAPGIGGDDEILLFCGRLLWTKGPQYVAAALPLVLERRKGARLLIAGDGLMREELARLIGYLDQADPAAAEALVDAGRELRAAPEFGPLLPAGAAGNDYRRCLEAARGRLRPRVHFLGHLPHARLAPLAAAADLVLAPSVFPEAFGLVSVEAMAAGTLPVATYQTGMTDPLDAAAEQLRLPLLRRLKPGVDLTPELAALVTGLLEGGVAREGTTRERLVQLVEERFSSEAAARAYTALARRR